MNQQLQPVEYSNQRILTTEQLAEAYRTDTNNIHKNFQRNKDRYALGKHYFYLEGDTLNQFKLSLPDNLAGSRTPQLYLWTEKGALMHAKSLNTDQAWAAYEMLVDEYYRLRSISLQSASDLISIINTPDDVEFNRKISHIRRIRRLDYPAQSRLTSIPRPELSLSQHIVRQVTRLQQTRNLYPTVADLRNYLPTSSVSAIQAECDNLVHTGILTFEKNARTSRYKLA